MSSVRLYGRVLGNGSHVQVTNGFRGVLEPRGMLAACVPLDLIEAEDSRQPGATAPHAVFTGQLGMLPVARRNTRHERLHIMMAPNSTRIPNRLALMVLKLHREGPVQVLAPSGWAADVLEAELTRFGDDDAALPPIRIVPHGLAWDFRVDTDQRQQARLNYDQGGFRVLHLSTTDRQRKGTFELVQAWTDLRRRKVLPDAATLHLVLDPHAAASLTEALMDLRQTLPEDRSLTIHARLDLRAADLAQVYAGFHVVCQPSRGEAFGFVPLEARACGVVVVATAATGHSQHMPKGGRLVDGCVIVPTGDLVPIDDLENALAPALSASDVAIALELAYNRWRDLDRAAQNHAGAVREAWSWAKQLAPFIEELS